MPKKTRWVVRVVIHRETMDKRSGLDLLLESLRYAGIVTIHRDNEEGVCFDLLPPIGTFDSKAWAENSARRMSTFVEFNAVCAPEWDHVN